MILEQLDQVIAAKELVNLKFRDSSFSPGTYYPHKIIFIEGELGLLAESVDDHCLAKIPISHIAECLPASTVDDLQLSEYSAKNSTQELEQFIVGLRTLLESEVRLLLKLYSLNNFNPNLLKYHYFRTPTMVTNPKGEYIWAAHVEPAQEIFHWIYQLGKNVEIIDPQSLKKQYLDYLEKVLSQEHDDAA